MDAEDVRKANEDRIARGTWHGTMLRAPNLPIKPTQLSQFSISATIVLSLMSTWSNVMSESNMHNNTLSISPSSDMFTSQQLHHAASPSAALSIVDDKELGFREGSSANPAKTESAEEGE